jgi:hypothetical protein
LEKYRSDNEESIIIHSAIGGVAPEESIEQEQ